MGTVSGMKTEERSRTMADAPFERTTETHRRHLGNTSLFYAFQMGH